MNDKNTTKHKNILIRLTHPEGVVLLELVSRLNSLKNEEGFKFIDQAEQRVLWDIESVLEKSLPDVFAENYTNIVKGAMSKVRDKSD